MQGDRPWKILFLPIQTSGVSERRLLRVLSFLQIVFGHFSLSNIRCPDWTGARGVGPRLVLEDPEESRDEAVTDTHRAGPWRRRREAPVRVS